jgi:hypothetical protein
MRTRASRFIADKSLSAYRTRIDTCMHTYARIQNANWLESQHIYRTEKGQLDRVHFRGNNMHVQYDSYYFHVAIQRLTLMCM